MGKQDYSDFTAVNEKQSEEWEWGKKIWKEALRGPP